jgi:hypothetical protein
VWREWGGLLDPSVFERLLILQQPEQISKLALNSVRLMAPGFERQLVPEQRTF